MIKRLVSLFTPLKSLVPIAVFLMIWEVMSESIQVLNIFVPPPSKNLLALFEGLVNLRYLYLTVETLWKMFFAYLLAALAAVPLGLILGWNIRIYRIFEPLVEALRPIPSVAWVAPAIIFFGLNEKSVIFVTFYALFWLFFIFSLYGVYSIDKLALLSFRAVGARDRDIFLKLILPGAMPQIAAALRQGIAVAFIVVVGGEMLLSVSGLGYYLLESERTFRYEFIYSTLMVLSLLGYSLNGIARYVEGRFTLRWAIESSIQKT